MKIGFCYFDLSTGSSKNGKILKHY